jgi:nucleolar protein 56
MTKPNRFRRGCQRFGPGRAQGGRPFQGKGTPFAGRPGREELRRRAFRRVREEVSAEKMRRDNLIVQVVETVDELDRVTNLLVEKLKGWYALYFPELARRVPDPDNYLELLTKYKYKEDYAGDLKAVAASSMGAALTKDDVDVAVAYGQEVKALRDRRKKLTEYLERLMREEAPNVNALVGPAIGARLIATAHSLERLAEMPASTVQVLGAESALFSHLRKHTLPPKHGIIFQYPKLRGAKKELRGKIARKLAGKLSIAAKLDFFKGEFRGEEMKKKLEADIDALVSK